MKATYVPDFSKTLTSMEGFEILYAMVKKATGLKYGRTYVGSFCVGRLEYDMEVEYDHAITMMEKKAEALAKAEPESVEGRSYYDIHIRILLTPCDKDTVYVDKMLILPRKCILETEGKKEAFLAEVEHKITYRDAYRAPKDPCEAAYLAAMAG